MPFSISPSSYQGGNFLFAGLSSVGEGAAKALQQIEDNRRLDSYNDTVVQHAFQNGQMSREDYDKYVGSSRTQKTGIAAGLAANFLQDFKQEELKSLRQQREAMAEYRKQQADALNFVPHIANFDANGNPIYPQAQPVNPFDTPPAQTGQEAVPGVQLIETSKGHWEVPRTGSGQNEVITDPLKVAGQVIPGIGVNRLTGQYVYYGNAQPGAAGVQVRIDEKTRLPYYLDEKFKPHFLNTQQIMAGQMMPQQGPTPTPAPSMFDQAYNYVPDTGDPFAGPAPMPTPMAAGSEAVPVTPDAQGQAAAIKQAFKAGKITREEALKQLRALGFK